MTNGTRQQVAVSTLSEAEFYADNSFEYIAYAYPLTADKIPQVVKLTSSWRNSMSMWTIVLFWVPWMSTYILTSRQKMVCFPQGGLWEQER